MYFAPPPISNGAALSIRLSNPKIRRLCFYPSLRTTRKISQHSAADTMLASDVRRAGSLVFCRADSCSNYDWLEGSVECLSSRE